MSLVAMGHRERSDAFGKFWRAGIGVGVEWALLLGTRDLRAALFLERRIDTPDLVGVRLGYGVGQTPRAADQGKVFGDFVDGPSARAARVVEFAA